MARSESKTLNPQLSLVSIGDSVNSETDPDRGDARRITLRKGVLRPLLTVLSFLDDADLRESLIVAIFNEQIRSRHREQ